MIRTIKRNGHKHMPMITAHILSNMLLVESFMINKDKANSTRRQTYYMSYQNIYFSI